MRKEVKGSILFALVGTLHMPDDNQSQGFAVLMLSMWAKKKKKKKDWSTLFNYLLIKTFSFFGYEHSLGMCAV